MNRSLLQQLPALLRLPRKLAVTVAVGYLVTFELAMEDWIRGVLLVGLASVFMLFHHLADRRAAAALLLLVLVPPLQACTWKATSGVLEKSAETLEECIERDWRYEASITYEPHRDANSFGQGLMATARCENPRASGSKPE